MKIEVFVIKKPSLNMKRTVFEEQLVPHVLSVQLCSAKAGVLAGGRMGNTSSVSPDEKVPISSHH